MRWDRLVCVSLCGLCVSAHASVSAQGVTPETRTSVTGAVFDPQNYAITGAEVIVEAALSGQRWQITTDRLGGWELRLPSGRYTLRIAAEGFEPHAELLVVPPAGFVIHGVTLRVAPVREPPVVVGRSPSLSPSSPFRRRTGAYGREFDPRDLLHTPSVHGASLHTAWQRTPGITPTEQTGTSFQFSTHGLRREENGLWIGEGPLDIGNDTSGFSQGPGLNGRMPPWAQDGSTKTVLPFLAMAEIQVMTADVPARYRRSPGAQTQIIPRSGTDTFKGMAFVDRRMDGWSADDYFLKDRDIDLANGGAGLGGPIVRGRAHWYGAFERLGLARPVDLPAAVPSDAARATAPPVQWAILDAYPHATGADLGNGQAEYRATIPAESDLAVGSLRIDSELFSSPHRLSWLMAHGRSRGDEVDPLELKPQPFFTRTAGTRTTHGTLTLTSILSSRTLHELHLTAARQHSFLYAGSPLPLPSLVSGVSPANTWASINLTLGTPGLMNQGSEGDSRQTQVFVRSATTLQRGAHLITVGGDLRHGVTAADPPNLWVSAKVGTVPQFVQSGGALVTFDIVQDTRVLHRDVALWIEDTWRASSRLTIRSGLRWDVRPAPTSLTGVDPFVLDPTRLDEGLYARAAGPLWRTAYGHVAPHVAAELRLRETTVIRTGAGLTWGNLTAPGALAFRTYPYAVNGFVKGVTLPVPAEKLMIDFSPTNAREFIILQDDLRRPRISEWNVGLEHGVGRAQMYLTYIGNVGRDLTYAYRQYVGDFGQYLGNGFTNDGRSRYQALHLGGRFVSNRWSVEASYTRSRALDNYSGESSGGLFGTDLSPRPSLIKPASNRGPADYDRPNALYGAVSLRPTPLSRTRLIRILTADWLFAFAGRAQSSTPVTIVTSHRFDGAVHQLRPDVVPGVPTWISDPTSSNGRRINPAAFQPSNGQGHGTHGRNSLRGPGCYQIDAAASRSMQVAGVTLNLRVEAYNVFNTSNFAPPYTRNLVSPDFYPRFGQPYMSYAQGLGSGTLIGGGPNPARQAGGPRAIHVGFDVRF